MTYCEEVGIVEQVLLRPREETQQCEQEGDEGCRRGEDALEVEHGGLMLVAVGLSGYRRAVRLLLILDLTARVEADHRARTISIVIVVTIGVTGHLLVLARRYSLHLQKKETRIYDSQAVAWLIYGQTRKREYLTRMHESSFPARAVIVNHHDRDGHACRTSHRRQLAGHASDWEWSISSNSSRKDPYRRLWMSLLSFCWVEGRGVRGVALPACDWNAASLGGSCMLLRGSCDH